MREEYKGSINVGFNGMPSIALETLIAPSNASALQRFSFATKRRRFTLQEDWEIDLSNIDYVEGLNGTVVVPKNDSNAKPNVFDGATVPVPWLVSLLTIGVLRPLGVMLIGSILHDYAYGNGVLPVRRDGEIKEIPLKRHHADKLFRDIIGTVNSLPFIGYVAWLAVRIGWLVVPYNGTFRTGRKPYSEYIFLAAVILLLSFIAFKLGFDWLLYIFLGGYLVFYLISLRLQRKYE